MLNERVEELSEKRVQKLNILKTVEEGLDKLRQPMHEAVGYLKVENKIIKCQNMIYQNTVYVLRFKSFY